MLGYGTDRSPDVLGGVRNLLLLSCALAAATARAHTNSDETPEIVVTAQKREQAAQDVGMSVVGMSGDFARQRGIAVAEALMQTADPTDKCTAADLDVALTALRESEARRGRQPAELGSIDRAQ